MPSPPGIVFVVSLPSLPQSSHLRTKIWRTISAECRYRISFLKLHVLTISQFRKLEMLSTRAVCQRSCFFNQTGRKTLTRNIRSFHRTSFLYHNRSESWLSKASNVVFNTSETLLRNSYKRLGGLVQTFDDLLGISEVNEAQLSVKKAEGDFMKTRGQVQAAKSALDAVQERLREVRRKLDRVPRDDERYLALATEEHKILVEEKKMKSDYESLEALERDQFALLSGAVRDSHERERTRAERTKHWSVIGSVGGAALGKKIVYLFFFGGGGRGVGRES